MMNADYQREMISFDEKIALGKLEEAKAHQRVLEIEFQKARFNMEMFINAMKEQQKAQPVPPPPQG